MNKLTVLKQSKPADLAALSKFEGEYGFLLPGSYKSFLVETNIISARETLYRTKGREFWISDFYPFDESLELSLQFVQRHLGEFFENKYLAFAGDAGGSQFVISVQDEDHGKVYFCRMDEELEDGLTLLADSFEEFVDGLQKDEAQI